MISHKEFLKKFKVKSHFYSYSTEMLNTLVHIDKDQLYEKSWEESGGLCAHTLKTTKFENRDIIYSPKDVNYPKNKIKENKEADEFYNELVKYQTGERNIFIREKDHEKIDSDDILYNDLLQYTREPEVIRDDDIAHITMLNDIAIVTLKNTRIETCDIVFNEKEDD